MLAYGKGAIPARNTPNGLSGIVSLARPANPSPTPLSPDNPLDKPQPRLTQPRLTHRPGCGSTARAGTPPHEVPTVRPPTRLAQGRHRRSGTGEDPRRQLTADSSQFTARANCASQPERPEIVRIGSGGEDRQRDVEGPTERDEVIGRHLTLAALDIGNRLTRKARQLGKLGLRPMPPSTLSADGRRHMITERPGWRGWHGPQIPDMAVRSRFTDSVTPC